MPDRPAINDRVIIVLDQSELAIRIGEAMLELPRPKDRDPDALLMDLNPTLRNELLRAARAALEYLEEQLGAGGTLQ